MPIEDTPGTPEPPKAFSMLEMLSSESRYATPTVDSDGFSISDDHWRLLLRNILTGTNTMMIGPTGTGKTELVMLACRKLGIECNVYNMGTIFDPISELLGVHRLVGGSSTFDYAKFAKDVQKPGVILLDGENANRRIEHDFAVWAKRVHLPAKLRTIRMARCQDGEAFAIMAQNPNLKSNVKLDLQLIEADRVTDDELNVDKSTVDGIAFDAFGNPSTSVNDSP